MVGYDSLGAIVVGRGYGAFEIAMAGLSTK